MHLAVDAREQRVVAPDADVHPGCTRVPRWRTRICCVHALAAVTDAERSTASRGRCASCRLLSMCHACFSSNPERCREADLGVVLPMALHFCMLSRRILKIFTSRPAVRHHGGVDLGARTSGAPTSPIRPCRRAALLQKRPPRRRPRKTLHAHLLARFDAVLLPPDLITAYIGSSLPRKDLEYKLIMSCCPRWHPSPTICAVTR